jgi:hypothetical protein
MGKKKQNLYMTMNNTSKNKTRIVMDSLGQDACEYNLPFWMIVDAETGKFIREATEAEIKNNKGNK